MSQSTVNQSIESRSSVGLPGNGKVRYSIGSNPTLWEVRCHPWIDEFGMLYQRQATATPPSKDFFLIWVTPLQVGFVVWQIKPPAQGSSAHKGAFSYVTDYETFKTDPGIRGAIQSRTVGELDFLDAMISGRLNYMEKLNRHLQIQIIKYLDITSVAAMAQTSSYFKKLCYTDDIWEPLFNRSEVKSFTTSGLIDIHKTQGWRTCYLMALRIMKLSKGSTSTGGSKSVGKRASRM